MSKDLESIILEFIKNRQKKGESTAPRHIHIRFDQDISMVQQILNNLENKGNVLKTFDKEYQENRYVIDNAVEE